MPSNPPHPGPLSRKTDAEGGSTFITPLRRIAGEREGEGGGEVVLTACPDPSDIHRGDRIERYLPASAMPYAHLARLDRPIGTWLLLFPGWWGTALAAQG